MPDLVLNPVHLRDKHPDILLLLGHHIPGIRRQEPLAFHSPEMYGGLFKSGELINRHLR